MSSRLSVLDNLYIFTVMQKWVDDSGSSATSASILQPMLA